MSRTDKDLPYWYAEYYEPFHRCTPHGKGSWRTDGACDLPHEPIVQSPRHFVRFVRRVKDQGKVPAANWSTSCVWEPVQPSGTKQWYNKNPSWWMNMVWTDPERGRVRDQSTKALQDYNANGPEDFEYDIPNFRRKHEGGWFW